MSPIRLEVNVGNYREVSRELMRVKAHLEHPQEAFGAFADQLVRWNRENFESEGAAVGHRWSPLSPAYAEWKAVHFPGRPILVRTGRLKKSLTARPMGIEHITSEYVELGTDVPYAQYHQRGSRRLPQRKPVHLNEQMKRDLMKLLQRYLTKRT